MATSQHLLLSPAELAYLRSSLQLRPPVRPDGRGATQFRPLVAETGVLPATNGSARVCFADGTEAVVGVKAEVERSSSSSSSWSTTTSAATPDQSSHAGARRKNKKKQRGQEEEEGEAGGDEAAPVQEEQGDGADGDNDWVELSVEIPGYRDDDSSTVFLATMLAEALLADGSFTRKLWINRRFHWKLYIDIILISPPLSYPLPLLSLTTHLALLATRLPRLKSELDEDPMFDDDWAAATYIYPRLRRRQQKKKKQQSRPPVTLLVMAVGDNIIFDPSKEELAVADTALAVSVGEAGTGTAEEEDSADSDVDMDNDGSSSSRRNLRLLSVRTIDPPSRLTAPGVPNAVNAAAWGLKEARGAGTGTGKEDAGAKTTAATDTDDVEGVWKAPRGGTKIPVLAAMVQKVLESGGVADEVLDGLDGVELE